MTVFDARHDDWVARLGAERLSALEDDPVASVAGAGGPRLGDLPGGMR